MSAGPAGAAGPAAVLHVESATMSLTARFLCPQSLSETFHE